jgi:hypothetical protein
MYVCMCLAYLVSHIVSLNCTDGTNILQNSMMVLETWCHLPHPDPSQSPVICYFTQQIKNYTNKYIHCSSRENTKTSFHILLFPFLLVSYDSKSLVPSHFRMPDSYSQYLLSSFGRIF